MKGIQWYFHRQANPKRPGVEVFYFNKVAEGAAEIPEGYEVCVNPGMGTPIVLKAGQSLEQKFQNAITKRDRSMVRRAKFDTKLSTLKSKRRKYKLRAKKMAKTIKNMEGVLTKSKARYDRLEKKVVKTKAAYEKKIVIANARLKKAEAKLEKGMAGRKPHIRRQPAKLMRLEEYNAWVKPAPTPAPAKVAKVAKPAPAPVPKAKKA